MVSIEMIEAVLNGSRNDTDEVSHVLKVLNFLEEKKLRAAVATIDSLQHDSRAITLVSSPSKRQLYLVRSSKSLGRNRHRSQQQDQQQGSEGSYVVLMPRPGADFRFHYCSCRAFHENSRLASNRQQPQGVCKHLLAVMLLPSVGVEPSRVDMSSETEFVKFVASRTSIFR